MPGDALWRAEQHVDQLARQFHEAGIGDTDPASPVAGARRLVARLGEHSQSVATASALGSSLSERASTMFAECDVARNAVETRRREVLAVFADLGRAAEAEQRAASAATAILEVLQQLRDQRSL